MAASSAAIRRAPCAIAFDLDGVFWRTPSVFDYTRRTIDKVKSSGIPFVILTNGGGIPESDKLEQINSKIGLGIREDQLIMSHTPLREYFEPYKHRRVLVAGGAHVHRVAESYGWSQSINAGEVVANSHPGMWPYESHYRTSSSFQARQRKDIVDFQPESIEAIAVLFDGDCWGSEIQIMVDALMHGSTDIDPSLEHPPIWFSCGDYLWNTDYRLPRFGQGIFRACLEAAYSTLNPDKKPLSINQLGKPVKQTYDYATKILERQAEMLGYSGLPDRDSIYMIGDNPQSDIAGGKGAGWQTVLLETGVWKEGQPTGGASHVVETVEHAVDLICSKHC